MSIEHYLTTSSPTVCDVFRAGAKDTWNRIQFSRSTKGMKCHETALTQNLVYEMRLLKEDYHHLEYDLFESENEKANGHDLLFRILHSDGMIYTYAIQAKVIYHTITTRKTLRLKDGWYPQLKHMVSKGTHRAEPQVDKLLRFAAKEGYIPMYLLYNYVSDDLKGTVNESHGCTVVGAKIIKSNYTDIVDDDLQNDVKFTDLHTTMAFPWEDLVCSLPYTSGTALLDQVGLPHDYNLKPTSGKSFRPGRKWAGLTEQSGVSEFIMADTTQTSRNPDRRKEIYNDDFNPKYMITVNLNELQ